MRQQNSNGGRRPRGRTNNRKQHGGGQHRSGTYDSNGPDGRIRGNASQVYEKYIGLARDATSAGDRIAAESYYQHAEHYFRIVNDSTDPESPGSQRVQNNQSQSGAVAQGVQDGQTPRPNGEIELSPVNQGASNQGASNQGGANQSRQNGRDHSARSDRGGQSERGGQNDRGGHQDRRGRSAMKNDVDVPGFEPQPDLPQIGGSAPQAGDSQSELPLSGDSRQRRNTKVSGRAAEPSERSAEDLESSVAGSEQTGSASSDGSIRSGDSAAVEGDRTGAPADDAATSPAPRRRGRPRKRPLEGDQSAASGDRSADGGEAVAETAAAPAKRRSRTRKTADSNSSADKDDSTEGPNAANA